MHRKIRLTLVAIIPALFIGAFFCLFDTPKVSLAASTTVATSDASDAMGQPANRSVLRASDGKLVFVYQDAGHLYFRSSGDNGLTWSSPTNIKFIDSYAGYTFDAVMDGSNNVYVTYAPDRSVYSVYLVKLAYVNNAWSVGTAHLVEGSGTNHSPTIVLGSGSNMWVGYNYCSGALCNYAVKGSIDGGVSWSAATALSSVVSNSTYGQLALYNNQYPIAVYFTGSGGVKSRAFNGSTWTTEATADPNSQSSLQNFSLVSVGGSVHYVGGYRTYGSLRHAIWSGSSWSAMTTVNASTADSYEPQLVTDGAALWLVYGHYNGTSNSFDIFYKKFNGTWDVNGTALTTSGVNYHSPHVPATVPVGATIPVIVQSGTSYPYTLSTLAIDPGAAVSIGPAITVDSQAPQITSFSLPATAASLTVGISSLAATDNVAVTAYMITESATVPAANAAGWLAGTPSSFTFSSAGTKTAYAWAKDAAGNVSAVRAASVVITLPANTCAFTYSSWGACLSNNTQTRTVLTQSPAGCTGGTPVLTQSCAYSAPQGGTYLGLTIPSSHPRLWFNPERLAQAKAYYQAHPFTPTSDIWTQVAFAHVVKGSDCSAAINWAMTQVASIPMSGVACDNCRWNGQEMILVYDWCYDQMTQVQRDTFTSKANTWIDYWRKQAWGDASMINNNYNWGYLRNELLWGIASYHENTSYAQTFLNDALTSRWLNSFVPAALTKNKGGLFVEGMQYGRYIVDYALVGFTTAALEGRDVFGESNWWKESVLGLIYNTTPALTHNAITNTDGFEVFPWSDDEVWLSGKTAMSRQYYSNPGSYTGDWMQTLATYWQNIPIGQFAQQWVNTVGVIPYLSHHVLPFVGSVAPKAFSSLPLDYFASGPSHLFSRTAWNSTSASLHFLLGRPSGVGHAQNDVGTWQIWRGGRWLSRESVSYGESVVGYNGSGSVGAGETIGHNGIIVNPDSQGCISGSTCIAGGGESPDYNSAAVVRRLESQSGYMFVSNDLSFEYRNNLVSSNHPERDNPAVKNVVRDFVYVRDLETLVTFDRLEASAIGTVSAANMKKVFLAHCELPWAMEDGQHSTCVNGTQALRVTTLVPAVSKMRASIVEGGAVGQHRLEITDSGSAQSYFLNVLQAKSATGASLNPTVIDNGSSYTVVLDATHSITFVKGMSSTGGSITINGVMNNFRSDVEPMTVTDNGPVWGSSSVLPVVQPQATTTSPTCSSFTYSAWGACQIGNWQSREVTQSFPAGCTGGAPILTQACTYIPPVTTTSTVVTTTSAITALFAQSAKVSGSKQVTLVVKNIVAPLNSTDYLDWTVDDQITNGWYNAKGGVRPVCVSGQCGTISSPVCTGNPITKCTATYTAPACNKTTCKFRYRVTSHQNPNVGYYANISVSRTVVKAAPSVMKTASVKILPKYTVDISDNSDSYSLSKPLSYVITYSNSTTKSQRVTIRRELINARGKVVFARSLVKVIKPKTVHSMSVNDKMNTKAISAGTYTARVTVTEGRTLLAENKFGMTVTKP